LKLDAAMLAQALGEYGAVSAVSEAAHRAWMAAENVVTSIDPRIGWVVVIVIAGWLGVRLFRPKP
jgi:hypothetical protein